MKGKSKKLKILGGILVASMAATMAFSLAACNHDPGETPGGDTPGGNNPGGDNPGITETTTYKVSIVGLKTQTITVEDGETLEEYLDEINLTPQKSGEKFVGWYEDGAATAFDWTTPITKNTTIRAKFEKIEGLSVKNGTAFPTEDGGFVTGSANTLYTYGSFEKGSFSVDVTPTKENNDCGVLFGAEESVSATWENFNYYTLLINKDGVMLLAAIPWSEVTPGVALSSADIEYDITSTYTLTVKYSDTDKYLECYVNNTLVMSTTLENGFYGSGVGCRAAVDGTVYGAMTFDEDDIPEAPATVVGDYLVRNGAMDEDDGTIKTTLGSTLAIVKDEEMGSAISYTMKRLQGGTCDGIVFGLTDNENANYWEGSGANYYFFFIGEGGEAGVSKIYDDVAGPWHQLGDRVGLPAAADGIYKLEVVFIGGKARLFANGVQCFVIENDLEGKAYGIRAQQAEVEYTKEDLTDKVAVVIEGATTELKYVGSGSALTENKPENPDKDGYIFEGWYAGESATEYDWSAAVNENVVITAKFVLDEGAKYAVQQGRVEESDFSYKTTAGSTLLVMNNISFNGGSIEVNIKPNTANDCGLIFGANVTDGATWENFDYFTVLINTNGTILFAKLTSWAVMASSPILEAGGFNPTATYTVKVLYTDGYARIYAKGGNVADYTLATTVYIGALKGTDVGFRAAAENTEFGKTVTIDADDNLIIPNANTDIELTDQRVGSVEKGENGVFTTTGNASNDFLALSSTTLIAGGCITVKMTRVNGDTGVIFGFTGNGDWEDGNTYYMLFIDANGSVRVASFPWEQWSETFSAVSATEEHTLTISYDGNGVVCFVDGTMYAAFDNKKLDGVSFGIRGKDGATYSDWSVVDYSQITDNTLTSDNND